MIKVAWFVPNTPVWVGGLNYFLNLASALSALPERRIEPVVLGNAMVLPPPLCALADVPFPDEVKKYSLQWLISRLERKFAPWGGAQARTFAKHGVKLFSHGWPLGRFSRVPSMCWIPDFQHKHLPHMFSPEEISYRDNNFAHIARNAQAVLLSSTDAQKDFQRFFPQSAGKAHVLRFVANPPVGNMDIDTALLHYQIDEPYFHIPNQLWLHKNHEIVLDALRVLQASGKCPLVISTGQTEDYRHPGYFSDLKKRVAEAGLAERFRFLGLIEFAHVGALMRGAVAMINPSRFEGWSTTVEEAKSLGKHILLSDIPVHREQAPERSAYFAPDDAETLAAQMKEALEGYSPQTEKRAEKTAAAALPGRMEDFAKTYEGIVLKVLAAYT